MAVGADLTITNTLITGFGAAIEVAKATADQTTDGGTQKFIYTPTGKPQKVIFLVHVGDASGVTITVTAGDNVFGQAAKVITTALKAADYVIQIETGAYAQSDGKIELTVDTIDAGKDLKNDHALTVAAIEII
jgi:hypothetical protein